MWFYIVSGFILLAAVIGFADIIAFIEYKLMCAPSQNKAAIIIPLKGQVENAEQLLRGALTCFKYQNPGHAAIFVVDLGITEETRRVCGLISNESPLIRICKQDEMEKMLQTEKKDGVSQILL